MIVEPEDRDRSESLCKRVHRNYYHNYYVAFVQLVLSTPSNLEDERECTQFLRTLICRCINNMYLCREKESRSSVKGVKKPIENKEKKKRKNQTKKEDRVKEKESKRKAGIGKGSRSNAVRIRFICILVRRCRSFNYVHHKSRHGLSVCYAYVRAYVRYAHHTHLEEMK